MASSTVEQAELLAADAIGEVIEHWGFRKALGRLWTVLYLSDKPLGAAELGEFLAMSSGAVSTGLSELQHWGVVRRVWVPGERREFFEAETDLWRMVSKVVRERERHVVGSVRERLEQAEKLAVQAGGGRGKSVGERVERLVRLARTAEGVLDAFVLSHTVDFSRFAHLLDAGRAVVRGAARTPGPRGR